MPSCSQARADKASVAVAHSMIVSAWQMLGTGETYRELGAGYYTRRNDPERQARRLNRQLENLGYTVSLTAA
jgi:transposase